MTWPGKIPKLPSARKRETGDTALGTDTATTNFGGITEVDTELLLSKQHVQEFIDTVSAGADEIEKTAKSAAG
jgi:hypothetical protein